jgi:simple sugar transport system ATP-binding protein
MNSKLESQIQSQKPGIEQLEMRGIVKRFPGVLANDHINFDIAAGEVHALLGENGAGKSTLMRILYGLYRQDEGEILINGEPVNILSPLDAIHLGIGMIHQHFMLVPTLTVAENVALGLRSTRGLLTDLDRVSKRISELAETYGLRVDPNAYVWQLAVGQQQRVEIIKALYRGADLLILDEPTAVLTPQEVDELFNTLRQMKQEGHGLIFISHKLHEVINISDRVTVLRDGRVVDTRISSTTDKALLARMMVGREIGLKSEQSAFEAGEVRLSIRDLWAIGDRATPALRGINLEIRSGEILGVAGVSGNGQKELAQVIAGLRESSRGAILLDGKDVTGFSPGALMKHGLGYIPEERMRDGMIREFTVSENLILREHADKPYARSRFLSFKTISEKSSELVNRFNVKTPTLETQVRYLSGGNIQKLILARELSRQPRVLIASQPTRGLDIGATVYVHQVLIEQRSGGTATLLISEDLDEILALSDRIIVIYEGQIMGEFSRDHAAPETLGLLMAGVKIEQTAD